MKDVTPLKELKNLTTLGLSFTEVNDVSPLKDLKEPDHQALVSILLASVGDTCRFANYLAHSRSDYLAHFRS